MSDLEKVLEDVSSTYSIPLSDLKSRYVDGKNSTANDDHDACTCSSAGCYNASYSQNVIIPSCGTTVMMANKENQPPKKRGRKKKQKEEVIEMEEYMYDGVVYLIDANNNVYTFDLDAPHLIGERFVDGTVRFF